MPVVPFDPTRARPRGQARPPKLPEPTSTAVPPRAAGLPPRAGLPPVANRPGTNRPAAERPATPGTALAAGQAPVIAPPTARWSSEPLGGVMVPAATPLPTPRLAVNLSPAGATRVLAMLGLAVACGAAVATTLSLVAAQPGTISPATPAAISQLTNFLVAVPWLFVAVVLGASARVERLVRPEVGPAWATLAFAAAACGAMQVVGRDLVSTWMLVTRAGLIVVATAALSVAFRQFLSGPSKLVRAQIVGGAFGGLLAGLGPFDLLGRMSSLAGTAGYAPLDAILNGADALLGLVLATFTIQATLIYVRDFLPDFNIALETATNTPEPELTTAAR